MNFKPTTISLLVLSNINLLCSDIYAGYEVAQLKVIPNERANIQRQIKEGLPWVNTFLQKNADQIINNILHQAALRNHDIEIGKTELSLFVDDSGAEWNGIWALIASGQDSVFQSGYRYYFEFHKDKMIVCRVYGVGIAIGVPWVKSVRERINKMDKRDMLIIEIPSVKKEIFAGLWKLDNAADGSVEECFGFMKDNRTEHHQEFFLMIDKHLSCVLISPYSGIYREPWAGSVSAIQVPNFGDVYILSDSIKEQQSVNFQNAKIISLLDTGKLGIWHNGEYCEFKRTVKEPKFEVDKLDIDILLEQRAGYIVIKEVP